MKPNLKDVTLVCADTTDKAHLAERAILKSLEQCSFGGVKFFTHRPELKHAVIIPRLKSWGHYSQFITNNVWNYIATSHILVVQWDGHVVDGGKWSDEFLRCDYLGPYLGEHNGCAVYNGGFSLRSRRLFNAMWKVMPGGPDFEKGGPQEDAFICVNQRRALESLGCVIGDRGLARSFAVDGSSVNSGPMNGEFGFHSYCTVFPGWMDRPIIYHHSGDSGDAIYSLSVVKMLGGGDYFFSPECDYPTRNRAPGSDFQGWCRNIVPLFQAQPYIWNAHFSAGRPKSVDVDFNRFRDCYIPANRSHYDNTASLISLQGKPFGISPPEDKPWLVVDKKMGVGGRPIVVNLTPRYRNPHFPWLHLIKQYGDQMVFVGTPAEASVFDQLCYGPGKKVPWIQTANLLELARVIAGASVFIGNQSAPMAIALGLGVNVIQECWQGNPNCLLRRPNAIYWGVNSIDRELAIPKDWITVH